MEEVQSLDATIPLWQLLRDDSDYYRVLMRGDDQAWDQPEGAHTVETPTADGLNERASVLDLPGKVHSNCLTHRSVAEISVTASSMEDEDEYSTDPIPMAPKSEITKAVEGAPQPQLVISFPLSEVRQNAFFFIVSRGGTVLEQPGNRRMRRIISLFAGQYVQTRRLNRGILKHQVYDLCRKQFEFVIQKQAFMRHYESQESRRRQLSPSRIDSILKANGGVQPIMTCQDTDFVRVGEECALDVVGHLLRDAANEYRRSSRGSGNSKKCS